MVLAEDGRFKDVPEERRMRAFACYEAGKAADDRQKSQLALAGIEERLLSMEPWAAAREQRKVAGTYSKYLECRVEDDKLTVVRKRNALSFAANREGMFVMFSYGIDDWDRMMSCYDRRTFVEQAFDALKNELDGDRWRTADPVSARGWLFIKFVSLILWCEASRLLRSAKNSMTVAATLQSLDNVMVIGVGDEWRVTGVTKKNRISLEALGLRAPDKRYVLKERDYIPKKYQH